MSERAIRCALALMLCGCASSGDDDGARRDGAVVSDAAMDGGTEECAEGDPCDADGDGCTQDLCRGGECVAGSPVTCDDGASCTTDVCVSTGPTSFSCEQSVSAGRCFAGGECRSEGDRDPTASCRVCDPSQSATDWSNAEGACDDGDACTTNDACRAGNCEGDPRVDDFEPNDDMAAPSGLGGVSDGDSYPAASLEASIYPDDDVDWFVYSDSDDFPSSIFPRAQLVSIPSGSNYDLCLFVRCQDDSTPSVDCTAGSREDAGGLRGCCSRNGASADENVRIDHDCDAVDDSADILVRVTKASGPPVCDSSYTLRYGDD